MGAERLVKISRDNIPAGRRSPGRPKRRWSDLGLVKQEDSLTTTKRKKKKKKNEILVMTGI